MAIGTAAALIGSAVIGAGASVYAGSQAKKASNKALDAQTQATNQQLQLQREQMNLARELNEPVRQGGLSAFDALLREYGLAPAAASPRPAGPPSGGVATPPAPTGYDQQRPQVLPASTRTGPFVPETPQAGGVDYDRLFQDRPDVMAEYERVIAQADRNSPQFQKLGLDRGPEGFADWWLQNKPAQDTYAPPTAAIPTTAQPTTTPAPAPAQPTAPQTGTDLLTAQRPTAEPAPTFTRPEAMQAPGRFSFDPNQIANDPGFKFEMGETLKGVNAASAARGKLRSGDAAAALADRASGLAHRFTNDYFNRALAGYDRDVGLYQYQQGRADNIFQDDRAYGTGMWQFNTNRNDQNFNTDRGFQANRYDTRVGNLFNLAGMGQAAAGAVTGAGANYANNAGNIYGSQANAAADAAYNRGAANAQMVGGLAGAASNLFANWGGGARAAAPASTVGSVNFGSSLNNPFNRSYTF